MALQKQNITIPLGLGVQTKVDEKLVEAGSFNLVCENATFDKVGAVKKRQSYKSLSTSYYLNTDTAGTAAGTYTSDTYKPVSVAGLGKGVLLRNQIGEYYFKHKDNFVKKSIGAIPEVKIDSEIIYKGITTVSLTDAVYDSNENIICVVSKDGHPSAGLASCLAGQGSTITLYDYSKKTSVSVTESATVSGSLPMGFVKAGYSRVGGESYYYNAWVDSDRDFNISSYNKYGQKYATETIAGCTNYDSGSTSYGTIANCNNTTKTISYFIVNTNTNNVAKFVAMTADSKLYETTFTVTALKGNLGSYAFYFNDLIYYYYNLSGTARLVVLNPDGTVALADASYSTDAGSSNLSGDQDDYTSLLSNGNGTDYVYFDNFTSTNQNYSFIASDKVTIGGVECVWSHDQVSNTLSTYYLLGLTSTAYEAGYKSMARLASNTAYSTNFTEQFMTYAAPRIAKIDANTGCIALPKVNAVKDGYATYSTQLVFFEINPTKYSYNRAILGPNLHFQGGYVAEFDGNQMIENGFLGVQSAPSLNTSGAGSLTGTYSYITLLKYTDKSGQITLSAPSLATSTGAITGKQVVVSPQRMPFGIKAKNCTVEIYRTTNGGSVYYYVGQVFADMYGTLPTFTDNQTDATITDNAVLYTTGGVLQNDPAPACKLICQGANRVFLAGLEDANEVAYSKKKLFGECVNFSDFFRIRFDSSQYNIHGGVTGISYMDDKLIVFKRNSVFYVAGDGPNELGQNDTFTAPELISSDTGCVDPRSVVLTPVGTMFKGDKGIYLLSRGLTVEYIGAPVEEFNTYDVYSSVHIDKKNHVVFTLKDSGTSNKYQLVFDYYTKQWSVNTGLIGIDSDVVDGDHILLTHSNYPMVQNGSNFRDDSTDYAIKVKTPWIKVTGIQDFGRIWSMYVLGKFKSAHTLRVTAYFDYNTATSYVYNISPLVSDAQYQYKIHLENQKCEAVQFVIEDVSQQGTYESMELSALTLEVGVKSGGYKLNASRKY